MSAPAVEPWLDTTEPGSVSAEDIYLFFGIPPSDENDLDVNIKKKRQYWQKRANGPAGRELARKVKKNIQNLSKVIKEGTVPDRIIPTGDGKYQVLGDPSTPAEVAEHLEAFLRLNDLKNVVSTARYALQKWPNDVSVLVAIALALTELAIDNPDLDIEVIDFAKDVSEKALENNPDSPDVWLARGRLLMVANDMEGLVALESQAAAQGLKLSGELLLLVARSLFRQNKIDEAIKSLVRTVELSGGDPGVRSEATDIMLRAAIIPLLPIASSKEAKRFAEYVNVAAWLAEGVPESEAELIKFRVWATEARTRVFVGSQQLKSFFGVLTGFTALPLVNKLMSRPAWRILYDGPLHRDTYEQWLNVTEEPLIKELHSLSPAKFEWETRYNLVEWPDAAGVVAALEQSNRN